MEMADKPKHVFFTASSTSQLAFIEIINVTVMIEVAVLWKV